MASHNLYVDLAKNAVIIGNLAEEDACLFLKKQGLTYVEKNFTGYDQNGKKSGEIDLIMRDADHLVFIEVKTRCNPDYGHVLEMISKPKMARIIRTATYFLQHHNLLDNTYCRFDVVGISPNTKKQNTRTITWIKDAFQVQY